MTHVSDAGIKSEREELVAWATKSYPDLNVLVGTPSFPELSMFASDHSSYTPAIRVMALNKLEARSIAAIRSAREP